MSITKTWTDPSEGGDLDLTTGQKVFLTTWEKMISNFAFLGGVSGYIGARVTHDAAQSIPHETDTALAFNTERFDTDAFHDTVTNNDRLTCTVPGTYLIIGNAAYANNGSGWRELWIEHNGTTIIGGKVSQAYVHANTPTALCVSTVYNLALNDYLKLKTWQTSGGGALNVVATAGYIPTFLMIKV